MAYGGNFFLYNDCYVDKDVTKIQKFCQRMLATVDTPGHLDDHHDQGC